MGQTPNMVFGLFLCRGGLSSDICRDFVSFAVKDILNRCPDGKEALIYYDEDMLRYADRNILLDPVTETGILMMNEQYITANQSDRFNDVLFSLMNETAKEAADSSRKFAVNKENFASSQTIYVMLQCTLDLTRENCSSCLQITISRLPRDKVGGRLLWPSCTLRYELYLFYNETIKARLPLPPRQALPPPMQLGKGRNSTVIRALPPPLPPRQALPPPPQPGKGRNSTVIIIAIVVPLAVSVMLFIACYCIRAKRAKTAKKTYEAAAADDDGDDITTADSLQFDLKAVEAATEKFSESNRVGQGGFGEVYKGTFPNGLQVAVKRLSKTSGHGEKEFKNEVIVVAKLQHRNLVRILGFCLEREEKLLVYEFVPNKSLLGFQFLAFNMLLSTQALGFVSGYMSPEYAIYGQFSTKSDVYSFGVLVLEIISGKKNSSLYQMDGNSGNLVTYTWRLWSNGSPLELVDPSFQKNYQVNDISRCIHIALLCVQEEAEDRPTMSAILQMLTTSSIPLAAPRKPGFFFKSRHEQVEGAGPSMDSSAFCSIDDASITHVTPR